MKLLIHLVLSAFAAFLSLIFTLMAVIVVQMGIHGDQAFEHDAGASAALTILGLFIGAPVAILCFVVVLHRLHSKRWLPQFSN